MTEIKQKRYIVFKQNANHKTPVDTGIRFETDSEQHSLAFAMEFTAAFRKVSNRPEYRDYPELFTDYFAEEECFMVWHAWDARTDLSILTVIVPNREDQAVPEIERELSKPGREAYLARWIEGGRQARAEMSDVLVARYLDLYERSGIK